MSLEISQFAILGLHGKLDINLPIRDNRLILIGVNGLGKTTVVNFMYFVLTDQWVRLLDFEFAAIEITINSKTVSVSKDDVQRKAKSFDRYQKVLSRYTLRSSFPPHIVRQLIGHPLYPQLLRMPATAARDKAARQLGRELGLPPSYLLRMLDDMPSSLQEDLFESRVDPASIVELTSLMQEAGKHQVIYLPTYRRIEQDLKAVFPNADEDELRKLTSAAETTINSRSRGHVELVQFGMHDVEQKISEELDAIEKRTRAQLSSLTGSYLQDIIRSRADTVEPELIKLMSDDVVAAVLSRVEENTLSADDKREVGLSIRRLRSGDSSPAVRDRYLTYFFSRLLDIYKDLYSSEMNIRRLVETCNRYFERKRLVYNDADFTSQIIEDDGAPLSWKVLSSGEKQIASLFTHLYLSKEASQIVLIDEPELSLSVTWQKNLLPDIVRSENCKLLIAVTHSPFIYANGLEKYAVDLSRFIGFSPTTTQ